MEPIELNGVEWNATATETSYGFLLSIQDVLTVPAGYEFDLARGLRSWRVRVLNCLRCPAGELKTWLKLEVLSGPVMATRAPKVRKGSKRW